jgi:hypothetical protein
MNRYLVEGLFKIWNGDPVVHRILLVVKYKDGSEKTERPGSAWTEKKPARNKAKEYCRNRENGSESDIIDEVTYKIENLYIRDIL